MIHPRLLNLPAEDVAETFRVLGDPTRVLILQALIESGGMCVQDVAETVGVSQSAVSHHLRVLRSLRLVAHERRGRRVFYAPDDDHVSALISLCVEHVQHSRDGRSGESRTSRTG